MIKNKHDTKWKITSMLFMLYIELDRKQVPNKYVLTIIMKTWSRKLSFLLKNLTMPDIIICK